jgi:uncharacterized protein (TIGR03086 family)
VEDDMNEHSMTYPAQTEIDWRALLTSSHETLRVAVAGIDDPSAATPCDKWSVTQVLQHAAGDQVGYAAAITGGPWPTENPFEPSGRVDGSMPALLETALARSTAAFAGISDDEPEVPTPLPQGAMPAWLAAGACALDAAVHGWDIAVATGQTPLLTPERAGDLMTVAAAIVEPLRAFAYAPAIASEPDADAVTALLNYLGRRADWSR